MKTDGFQPFSDTDFDSGSGLELLSEVLDPSLTPYGLSLGTKQPLRIWVDEGSASIRVECPPTLHESMRAIPGANWVKSHRHWRFPKTAHVARKVRRSVEREFPGAEYDPSFSVYFESVRVPPGHSYRQIRSKTRDQLPAIPIVKHEPWLRQLQAFWYAYYRESALLDMDMGTGKTRTTIDLIMNRGHKLVLVMAPSPIVVHQVWENEFKKHWSDEAGPYRIINVGANAGTVPQRKLALESAMRGHARFRGTTVVIVNYEAMWMQPLFTYLRTRTWDLVVAEESHRLLKPGGKVSWAAFEIGRKARFRLALSGTPMANSPLDIYSQFRFLDCGVYGTRYSEFLHNYAIFGGFQSRVVVGTHREDHLMCRYWKLAFRVETEDVTDLPPVTSVVTRIRMDNKTRVMYQAMKKEGVVEMPEGVAVAEGMLARFTRRHQLACGFLPLAWDEEGGGTVITVNTAKRDYLTEYFSSIAAHEPIVVFARYRPDIDVIRDVCKRMRIPMSELSGTRNEFKQWSSGTTRVLVCQIRSGAEGLDFTRARYVMYYSLTFSLREYLQSRKRTHRPGQTRPVFYNHLVTSGTIEATMFNCLRKKREVIDELKARELSRAVRRHRGPSAVPDDSRNTSAVNDGAPEGFIPAPL